MSKMMDVCLCGHGREAHADGFGLCTDCRDTRKGREVSDFTCRPGVCDRFTYGTRDGRKSKPNGL